MRRNKVLVGMISGMLLLSACSTGASETITETTDSGSFFKEDIDNFISTRYSLVDVVSGADNADNYESIYVAYDASLEEVAEELVSHKAPDEMSERKDDKQILVYDNHIVTLTKYEQSDMDVQIQVASKEFVRRNYSPSFFQGYLLASLIDSTFGNKWRSTRERECRNNPNGCYTGYSGSAGTGGSFRSTTPSTPPPSIRGSQNRGGGPGVGK